MLMLFLYSLFVVDLVTGLNHHHRAVHHRAVQPRAVQPLVQLGSTALTGKLFEPSVEFFGGIPFAEPPVGELRFSRPKLKSSLVPLQSFDASNYGKRCLQTQSGSDMSEDCLTLNVFRPSGIEVNSSLPVMVWIFGGGFLSGDTPSYSGTTLIKQSLARGTPILYVSINYRLGPLGFPQGPEAVKRGVLNLGLYDQLTALKWVQANIASFGGDPRKVTVFGESAGALSASYHYLNGDFSTVARAAIFQSGTASTLPIFDAYRGTPSWMLFVQNTRPCAAASSNDAFACLMTANSSDLLTGMSAGQALEQFPFRAVLDGPDGIMSDLPAKRLSSGAGKQIPFIAGTVLDEGTVFIPRDLPTERIPILLNTSYTPSPLGPDALIAGLDKVISLYPDDPSAGSPFGTGNQTFDTGSGYKRGAAIDGDILFQGPRRFWSQTASAPSYAYIFTDHRPGLNPAFGVYHSTELPYFFEDFAFSGPPAQQLLSKVMLDYWISFAVSLTPNDGKGTSRPHWGLYGETKEVIELDGSAVSLIPDNYRADSINAMIGMKEALSW